MNDKEKSLEASESSLEKWAIAFGGLVVVGLILETELAFMFQRADPLDTWGTVIADTFVAIGVAGEILFGVLARRKGEELRRISNEKVAAANERAAAADLARAKLESRIAPRRISSEQRAEIVASISEFAGTCISVYTAGETPEIRSLFDQVFGVLLAARWTFDGTIQPFPYAGVCVAVRKDAASRDREAASSLIAGLRKAGIDVSDLAELPGPDWPGWLPPYFIQDAAAINPTAIRIVIGHKPWGAE